MYVGKNFNEKYRRRIMAVWMLFFSTGIKKPITALKTAGYEL